MKQEIEQTVQEIIKAWPSKNSLHVFAETWQFDLPRISVERPKDDRFGDYTTNATMQVWKKRAAYFNEESSGKIRTDEQVTGSFKDGWDFTEDVVAELNSKFASRIKAEAVRPGHINFYLSDQAYAETLTHILKEGSHYGNSMLGDGENVNNEFISANPTGPLHLGNGRGGFYADSLSRIMKKAGYNVTNEYYVNDAGEQVMKLGHSILKDSDGVYGGEYIDLLAERLKEETDVKQVGEKGATIILEEMIKPMTKDVMRVHFDVWTSEKGLIEDGYVNKALGILKEKNLTFEQGGALWLRTTEFGDDKDRVMVKSDGAKTYFASDAGYILNKMERGFTSLIETWGADHHGYINRFKAVARALGFTGEIHFIIVQLVKLVKDGVEVRMSKRAGNVVGIDELIETVGHDVARFFFLMYSEDTHMNFDLGLAEERSEKNPVYYVQYAFARLSSIERKAKESHLVASLDHLSLLTHPKERLLIRELMAFPELINRMAAEKTVHALPQYAMRLADRLHSFYADCQVIDEMNIELSGARLALIAATKTVLEETLRLMGVSAPEKM